MPPGHYTFFAIKWIHYFVLMKDPISQSGSALWSWHSFLIPILSTMFTSNYLIARNLSPRSYPRPLAKLSFALSPTQKVATLWVNWLIISAEFQVWCIQSSEYKEVCLGTYHLFIQRVANSNNLPSILENMPSMLWAKWLLNSLSIWQNHNFCGIHFIMLAYMSYRAPRASCCFLLTKSI